MSGSIFGKYFQVSTWGESHGKGIGVVVDGCPAGLPLSEEILQKYLDRRKPGQTALVTRIIRLTKNTVFGITAAADVPLEERRSAA